MFESVTDSMGVGALQAKVCNRQVRKLLWAGQLETSGWLLCISDAGFKRLLVGFLLFLLLDKDQV